MADNHKSLRHVSERLRNDFCKPDILVATRIKGGVFTCAYPKLSNLLSDLFAVYCHENLLLNFKLVSILPSLVLIMHGSVFIRAFAFPFMEVLDDLPSVEPRQSTGLRRS